ncbi:Demethylmenaquinone methyltransferase [Cyberlindnera fabianii]|uniref:Demethylmenaquinone methyltransferase n=1 Tax=Cyberlindnera fabianii TaxID=36022 RepID=A0A1V2L4Q6_CYBFA|nr:Demethylmenaquinone methyltransferase [Cyberlindnera fabianii]
MDNPLANSSTLSLLGKSKFTGSSADLSTQPSQTDDVDRGSISSIKKHKHRDAARGYFSRHMKMTSLEKTKQQRHPSNPRHADAVKESYIRECERWYTTSKLDKHEKVTDPFTFATTRLDAFLMFYDSLLQGVPLNTPSMEEKQDRIGFWACKALLFLTGLREVISIQVLADFSNNQLKKKERLKVLYLMSDYYATQWSWQLAIDNPNTDVYCYTLGAIHYTGISEHRSKIGPPNYHILHGDTMDNIPFSKESFSSCVSFDLWLNLKEDEWVTVLKEINRTLAPQAELCLFVMDISTINCTNPLYNEFFTKLQEALVREGIDPFPCRKIRGRLSQAGFQRTKHAFISLKKGVAGNLGAMMELIQSFFEYVIFTKVAEQLLGEDELELFRELRVQYNRDLRNGEILDQFGDSYLMFTLSKK